MSETPKRPVLLLVDDMPANIQILASALVDEYEILVASDGESALEVARQGRPDLILLDIVMPGMDGYEVCRRLKESPETRGIPVIFVSGKHEEEDEIVGFGLGAVDYIAKPFSLPIVRARVHTHLALKQYRDFLEDCSHNERVMRLRVEEELRVAREVQMRLLPDVAASGPLVQAAILPAKEVAGDYFDLFRLKDGRLAFVIADVSGKGASAAFYTVETKGVLQALDKERLSPKEVAIRLNDIWRADRERPVFVTLVYGLFEPDTGRFAFIRAGHPAALLRRASGRVEVLEPSGMAIGFTSRGFEESLQTCEGSLGPGDFLVFYTDGLTEAFNADDELFGEERLIKTLSESAPDLVEPILDSVRQFTGERGLDDDLTILVLRRE